MGQDQHEICFFANFIRYFLNKNLKGQTLKITSSQESKTKKRSVTKIIKNTLVALEILIH